MEGNYKSLTELAQEIDSQEARKNDLLVPTNEIKMVEDEMLELDKEKVFDSIKSDTFSMNNLAHQQLASKLNIPKKYYDNMLAIPGLRSKNVNAWLNKEEEDRSFLIRTMDNTARAVLSDRFKPVDNILILNAFLPSLKDKEVQIMASSLTETRMYLQVTFPGIEREVTVGDVVRAGIILTNSEVGCGAVNVSSVIWRLNCSNGMVGKSILRKYHAGRRVGGDIEDYNIFRDDTIQAELESFKLRLRDNIVYSMSEALFETQVAQMRKLAGNELTPVQSIATVENVTKRYGFSENEKSLMTLNLGKEEKTRWGVLNSVTALAHELENPDRQYEIEKAGNDLLYLSEKQWEEIAV